MRVTQDWNPGDYARFSTLRLRPALDLLAQVAGLPEGDVVDLGCGAGAAAEALLQRFQGRRLIGVDLSAAMLAEAVGYHRLEDADIATWRPGAAPALIFSNAALHWLPDHGSLMPRLARLMAPGGTLAVQMPGQHDAPSHRLLREAAARLFPSRFTLADWQPPVADPADYWTLLSPFGTVAAWETEYLQHLPPSADGHPVRAFTASTAMRPWVAGLTEPEVRAFVDAYDAALGEAYPLLPDGSALMPFRRVFFTLKV